VDQLKDGFGTPVCLTRKQRPSLFANEATIAHLINMIKCRHAAHHVLVRELTHRVEVEMTEARVLEPHRLVRVHRHAHRMPNVQCEVVEPGPVSFHLGEKLPRWVKNMEDFAVDHDAIPGLVVIRR
jgi:hypothetical protein